MFNKVSLVIELMRKGKSMAKIAVYIKNQNLAKRPKISCPVLSLSAKWFHYFSVLMI